MFKLLEDYNENGVDLKAGKYSLEQLEELYGSKDKFNFCLQCTSLKNVLQKIETRKKTFKEKLFDKIEEIIEETDVKISIKYLVEKTIKEGKKSIFEVGDKLNAEHLEKFDIQALIDEGSLLEIKVVE